MGFFVLTDEIKQQLKTCRLKRGLNLAQVARIFEVDASTYWCWENGFTRHCRDKYAARLKEFLSLEDEFSYVHERKVNCNDTELTVLGDCLSMVSHVCNLVREDDGQLEEYRKGLRSILVDVATEHIKGDE